MSYVPVQYSAFQSKRNSLTLISFKSIKDKFCEQEREREREREDFTKQINILIPIWGRAKVTLSKAKGSVRLLIATFNTIVIQVMFCW
jgi:hypothetical protein